MKKIILAMVLVFALSSAAFAAGPVWGIGISNIIPGPTAVDGNPTQIPAGALFYNFNDQHSIEGDVGVWQTSTEGGDRFNITILGLRYLFNFYTSARFNSHIGIQGSTANGNYGAKLAYTDIGLIFGGEIFITDHFSLLADLSAHSFTWETEPTNPANYNTTAINVWPMLSFRVYM